MNNPFDEIAAAVERAQDVQRAVEKQANSMARLLRGNLHCVDPWVLQKLKRELQAFNSTRGRWKD